MILGEVVVFNGHQSRNEKLARSYSDRVRVSDNGSHKLIIGKNNRGLRSSEQGRPAWSSGVTSRQTSTSHLGEHAASARSLPVPVEPGCKETVSRGFHLIQLEAAAEVLAGCQVVI